MATLGKKWRDARKAELLLPSGNVAIVRNVPLSTFLLSGGGVPESLLPIVQNVIKTLESPEGNVRDAVVNKEASVPELLKTSMELMNRVCELAFVSPRIVANPTADDEISIDDVDDLDKEMLLNLFGMSARELEPFCKASSELMADVLAGEVPSDTPIGTDGDSNVKPTPDENPPD